MIGHTHHYCHPDVEAEDAMRALRQYTAGLSRVEVITYDQLADNAARALTFEHVTDGPPMTADVGDQH